MPRRRSQPPVRYTVTEHQRVHQVVDQLHGYALSRHADRPSAEVAARDLAADPAAAFLAVEALDAAQSGPETAERRILRRYGYAWSVRQDEMLGLMREFSHHRLETLVSAGHLAMAFSPAGSRTTPRPNASTSWHRAGFATARSRSLPPTAPASSGPDPPWRPCPRASARSRASCTESRCGAA